MSIQEKFHENTVMLLQTRIQKTEKNILVAKGYIQYPASVPCVVVNLSYKVYENPFISA